ncbi:serpin A12 [Trichechus inunguis]
MRAAQPSMPEAAHVCQEGDSCVYFSAGQSPRKMKPILGLGLLLAGLVAVKGLPQDNLSPDSHVAVWKGRQAAQELSRRNTAFGFQLFKKLSASSSNKNIFFSPLSISTAFSMLCLGAQDSALDEIKQVFNFTGLPEKDLHEGFHYLIQRLNQGGQNFMLNLYNMLFIKSGLQLEWTFLTNIKNLYNADIIPADFQNLEVTQKKINDYVSQETHGKINNLIKNIDPGTVMLLINTIFFQATWQHKFDPKATKVEGFMLDKNKSVRVPMMFRRGIYKVGHDDRLSCTVLEIPYWGNFTAIFVLPDKGKLESVEKGMVANVLARWKKIIKWSLVDVFVPKFSTTGTYDLKKVLSQMGIREIFEEHGGLTGISPHLSLKVSQVVHKARLEMDEKGTEGAAGSGSLILPVQMPVEVKLNRPFLMIVYEQNTDSVLFLGKTANPTGTNSQLTVPFVDMHPADEDTETWRAKREKPFDPAETSKGSSFLVDKSVTVQVLMTHQVEEFAFGVDPGLNCSVLQMDYSGDALDFFILPGQGKMGQLEQELSALRLRK